MMGTNISRRVLGGLAVVALLAGGAAVAATDAQQAGPRRGPMPGRAGAMRGGPLGAMRMGLAQLGLTDEQKARVKGILEGHKDQFRALREQIGPARRAVADAIATGDEAAIRGAAAKLAAAQADAAVLAGKVRGEVFGVLTPEQKQKAQELKARVRERMEKRQTLRKKWLDF